jgi:hypothetical protein
MIRCIGCPPVVCRIKHGSAARIAALRLALLVDQRVALPKVAEQPVCEAASHSPAEILERAASTWPVTPKKRNPEPLRGRGFLEYEINSQ